MSSWVLHKKVNPLSPIRRFVIAFPVKVLA